MSIFGYFDLFSAKILAISATFLAKNIADFQGALFGSMYERSPAFTYVVGPGAAEVQR
jgi:hypothetical protein